VIDCGWQELAEAVAGEVVRPGAAAYDALRRPAIARFAGAHPEAIVRCKTPEDVAAALAFARSARLPIAVRSGGHCFAGRSTTEGMLLDVSPLQSVTVEGGRATVGAGARLGDVYDALDAHGLTIPAGCGPTVGIAGLTLGGGLGILGRLHGLTSDALRAAQVVLADGRIVTCDDAADRDLFWALRGAGGARFGVVTSLVFETVPAPPTTAFELLWAPADAAPLLAAWQAWAPAAPDALAASLLLNADGDALRVRVFGAMAAAEAETTARLDELAAAAGAEPTSATVRAGSYREAKRFLSGLGDAGEDAEGHPHIKSEFLAQPLPAQAIDALLAHLRTAPAPAELDFSPWGGAYGRVAPEATAFAHRDARCLLKHAVEVTPAAADRGREWLARSWALAHPFGTGGAYPNFPDTDLDDWDIAYHGANRERLLAVKRRYDPDDVFS
jgi:FAD/FMN-containing dehydrogenase